MTAERLVGLYCDRGESIFPTRARFVRRALGFVRPKFGNDGLEAVVNDEIGPAKLSEALRELVITAYDMTEHRPRFLKRWTAGMDAEHADYPMAVAAMATASAPTYLPPWETEDDRALIDGGVFAANPTIAAIAEALKRKEQPASLVPHELFVVSRPSPANSAGSSVSIRGASPQRPVRADHRVDRPGRARRTGPRGSPYGPSTGAWGRVGRALGVELGGDAVTLAYPRATR